MAASQDADWLERFYRGERRVMDECYREYFHSVDRAVGNILHGADRETVVHEVFFRLISDEAFRRNFTGGTMGAWLARIARNQAIDHWRKYRKEQLRAETEEPTQADHHTSRLELHTRAKLFVEAFEKQLPERWHAVFRARFIEQLSQREAAAKLGMNRTTLAYQEVRVRATLRKYLRDIAMPDDSLPILLEEEDDK